MRYRISKRELLKYEAATKMVQFNENHRWTKFYNSLVFNSILLIAWATIYTGKDTSLKSLVLVLICFLGIILSFFWGSMGKRTSEYLYLFNDEAIAAERRLLIFEDGPFAKAKSLMNTTKFYQSSEYVVTYVPYFFALLYTLLIIISLWNELTNTIFFMLINCYFLGYLKSAMIVIASIAPMGFLFGLILLIAKTIKYSRGNSKKS